jgi:hypothetical protein
MLYTAAPSNRISTGVASWSIDIARRLDKSAATANNKL